MNDTLQSFTESNIHRFVGHWWSLAIIFVKYKKVPSTIDELWKVTKEEWCRIDDA